MVRAVLPVGDEPCVALGTLVTYAGLMLKALRWVLFAVVFYFFVLPLIPAFRNAVADLRQIDPVLLSAAIGLEFVALYCYTLLTHAALGPTANRLPRFPQEECCPAPSCSVECGTNRSASSGSRWARGQ
ncbi:MAG: hypothetical protein EBX38_06145, partial [Actinobacteria bacterium]|nr:hypothetical protein [Actinomycetota bacterium]